MLSLTLLLLSLLFPRERRHCQAHKDVRGENRTGSRAELLGEWQRCPHGTALPSPPWPYCSFQRCLKELTILTASFLPRLCGGITSPVGDQGNRVSVQALRTSLKQTGSFPALFCFGMRCGQVPSVYPESGASQQCREPCLQASHPAPVTAFESLSSCLWDGR